MAAPTPSRRPAFTIIELALSVMVMTALMAAMGSAVLLASKAIPDQQSPAQRAIAQARSIAMISNDIAEALHFTERTPTTLAFTVPDRDDDGNPERIRYAWDGTPANPLTRQVNASAPQTIVPNVQSLTFASIVETTSQSIPAPLIEGPEQIVAGYQAATAIAEIGPSDPIGVGESFLPALLPIDTDSWRLTGVETRASNDGKADGLLTLQIRPATVTGEPTAEILAQMPVASASLGDNTFVWTRVNLDLNALAPAQRYAFAFFDTDKKAAGLFEHQSAGVVSAGQALITGSDGGGWTADPARSLTYNIYGTPQVIGAPFDLDRDHVTALRIDLAGEVPQRATVSLLNTPQLVRRLWELDFDHDPTTIDADADDVLDWQTSDASNFDGASLIGGIWNATQTLVSTPASNLDTPLTVRALVRDATSSDGSSADLLLRVGRSAGQGANLRVRVERSGSAQRVALLHRTPTGVHTLAATTIDSETFLDLLVCVVPANQVVYVRVNGEILGAFGYSRFPTADAARIELQPAGGAGAEFAHVTVRIHP